MEQEPAEEGDPEEQPEPEQGLQSGPEPEPEQEPHEHWPDWPEPEQPAGILEGTPPPAAEPEPQPELAVPHEKRRQPRREEVAIEKPRTFTQQFAKAVDESPIVGSRSAAYTRGDDVCGLGSWTADAWIAFRHSSWLETSTSPCCCERCR